MSHAGYLNMPSKSTRHTMERNGKFLGKGRSYGKKSGRMRGGRLRKRTGKSR